MTCQLEVETRETGPHCVIFCDIIEKDVTFFCRDLLLMLIIVGPNTEHVQSRFRTVQYHLYFLLFFVKSISRKISRNWFHEKNNRTNMFSVLPNCSLWKGQLHNPSQSEPTHFFKKCNQCISKIIWIVPANNKHLQSKLHYNQIINSWDIVW